MQKWRDGNALSPAQGLVSLCQGGQSSRQFIGIYRFFFQRIMLHGEKGFAKSRTAQKSDYIGVRQWAGMGTAGDQAGKMGHVDEQIGLHRISDGAETFEIDTYAY